MEKTPEEALLDRALDHLAKAGWTTGYTRRQGQDLSIKWTNEGLRKLEVLWRLFTELNEPEKSTGMFSGLS
jgi:DNA-binding PadR family transcriptional regulator